MDYTLGDINPSRKEADEVRRALISHKKKNRLTYNGMADDIIRVVRMDIPSLSISRQALQYFMAKNTKVSHPVTLLAYRRYLKHVSQHKGSSK